MFSEHQAGVGRLSRLCEGSATLLLEWAGQLADFQAEAAALEARLGHATEDFRHAVASGRAGDLDDDQVVQRRQDRLARMHQASQDLRDRYLAAGAALALRIAGLDLPGHQAAPSPAGPDGISTMMTAQQGDSGNPWDIVNEPHADPAAITGSGARAHIIWGEEEGGGGHYYDSGQPDKTVFPKSWSPDKIMENVEDVAKNPDTTPIWQPDEGTFLMTGTRDGVTMNVAVNPEGQVVTGFPTAGNGVCVNDSDGDPQPLPDQDDDDWGAAEAQAQGESEDQADTSAANAVAAAQAQAVAQAEELEAEAMAEALAEAEMVEGE